MTTGFTNPVHAFNFPDPQVLPDGQDWFARIFGRAGFTLLPDPARLPKALPDIYHGLTSET